MPGISVARLIPNPLDLSRSDRPGVPRRLRRRAFKSSKRGDLSYVGHLRGYHDSDRIDQSRSRRLVLARTQRRPASCDDVDIGRFTTQLFGVDATVPLAAAARAIYHQFVGADRVDLEPIAISPDGLQQAIGLLRLRRLPVRAPLVRWRTFRSVGSRGRSVAARSAASRSSLTYLPSEFSQMRGQYRRTAYATARRRTSSCSSSSLRSARTARTRSEGEHVDANISSAPAFSLLLVPAVRRPPQALKVVTTTEDLGSLAREVGGDKVAVDAAREGLSGSALRRSEAELHPRGRAAPTC